MRVSPEARPPNMNERCEIDLSPGTRAVPESGGDRRAVAGAGGAECDMIFPFAKAWAGDAFAEVLTLGSGGLLSRVLAAVIPSPKPAGRVDLPPPFGFDTAENCD